MNNNFFISQLSGDSAEIGKEHGNILGKRIRDTIERFSFALTDDYGKDWSFFKEFVKGNYSNSVEPDYYEEILNIVKYSNNLYNSNLEYEDLLTLNCIPEIDSYFSMKKNILREPHCSSFIANGKFHKGEGYILGHTTWWRYYTAINFNNFLIYKPNKGFSFAMQTAPGFLFSFTDFYYNSKGIAISETTMDGINTFNLDGKPLFQRLRKAIQYSSSIEDVVYFLTKDNNGSYANDYLIGSKDGIAILELGTYNYALEKKREGFFVSSNKVQFENLKEESLITYENDLDSDSSRFKRLSAFITENTLTIENSKLLLSDHYDHRVGKDNPGKNSICGHREVEPFLDKFDKRPPFFPTGSIDGKIVTLSGAINGNSYIKWGKPCNTPFYANNFVNNHPEYEYLRANLSDIIPSDWQYINHGWE